MQFDMVYQAFRTLGVSVGLFHRHILGFSYSRRFVKRLFKIKAFGTL